MKQCRRCSEIIENDIYTVCPHCGSTELTPVNNAAYQYGNRNDYVQPNYGYQPTSPAIMSKADFFKNDLEVKKKIDHYCIASYIGSAVMLLLSVFVTLVFAPLSVASAIIEPLIIVGLTVVLQLTHNKAVGITLGVVGILETVFATALMGKPQSLLWAAIGVGVITVFINAEKKYKEYCASFGINNSNVQYCNMPNMAYGAPAYY